MTDNNKNRDIGEANMDEVGQLIRYAEGNEGRFVPISTEQWLKTFSIDDGAVKPN